MVIVHSVTGLLKSLGSGFQTAVVFTVDFVLAISKMVPVA